ncbi:ATP-dependent RNA helicase, partial [Skeletonema marinoi]
MAVDNTKSKSKNSGGGFESLNLSPAVFSGIKKLGYRTPTPVQRKSLPVLLSGTDAVVMARTGSGKTVSFLIPVLERLLEVRGEDGSSSTSGGSRSAFAVILSPTRELSVQTLKVLRTLGHHCLSQNSFKFIGVNGGEGMEKQFSLLSSHPDIIVATPGRLAHHLSEIPDFHLRQCEMAVFDEADRLFEMGFVMQLRQICSTMPENSQKMLFSATMPKALMEFTKTGMMHDPVVVRLDNEVAVSEELRIGFVTCRSAEKDAVLLHLVRDVLPLLKGTDTTGANVEEEEEEEEPDSKKKKKKKAKKQKHVGKHSKRGLTLVFVATRHHCEYITLLLNTSGLSATQIYGNMDNSARQHNLNSFQSGRCPILVVTDVAARGIDIPLIDHVIHYAFPPSAKLFIHRSGRAARAGRIGFCWGIVDPEELPYMVDLHVFLGRKMSTGLIQKTDGDEEDNDGGDDEAKQTSDDNDSGGDEYVTYTLDEMTPDMVHYGVVPESILVEEVENVRRLVDSELAGTHDSEQLANMARVCNNAMKKYRRTRPEASRDGVRRAKALLEGDKEKGGQRILKARGGIPTHPLLRLIEIDRLTATVGKSSTTDTSSNNQRTQEMAKKKMNDLQKRQEFLRAMSNFRPKETVFEAFATGGQKDMIYSSQVDKNKSGSAAALVAMKNMRRQMKMARHKGSSLVVAGSSVAQELNGDVVDDQGAVSGVMMDDGDDDDNDVADQDIGETTGTSSATQPQIVESKRRLSKAERKKRKKDPSYKPSLNSHEDDFCANDGEAANKRAKTKRGSDFRDEANFIDNKTIPDTAAAARERQMEAAMQPSASNSAKGTLALAHRIEESMLDIVGDENIDLVKRHRMMRWDRSKRKYVQTTVGEELSGMSTTQRTKLESGQMVDSKKMKIGELYEKWQKKTNRSIGRVGVFDDVTDEADVGDVISKKTKKEVKPNGKNTDDVKKTAVAIRKEREKKDNLRVKNMRKEDRRILERKERSEKIAAESTRNKGFNGKKGKTGRWKN